MYRQICCGANAAASDKPDAGLMMVRRKWLAALIPLVATALVACVLPQSSAQTPGGHVVVFATASLENALDAISEHAEMSCAGDAEALLTYVRSARAKPLFMAKASRCWA